MDNRITPWSCPYCGSSNIVPSNNCFHYLDFFEKVYYECECKDCGGKYESVFNFCGMNIKEDGEEVFKRRW